MSFIETRGMLARLLATENLVVEHNGNAKTASFNTEDRVLTLPVINTDSEQVYNLMTAHEVGHALWTPPNWCDQVPSNVPFDFVNVIEDVRIERGIQDKYPGLRRDFSIGYDELSEKDFFGIADKDISKMSLIDRINLHFKLGVRAVVPFTDEEIVYVNAARDADTFDKVLLVATMLRDYVDANRHDESDTNTTGSGDGQGESTQQTSGMNADDADDSDDTQDSQSDQQDYGDDTDDTVGDQPKVDETVSDTQSEFDKNMEKLASNNNEKFNYVKLGKFDPSHVVEVDMLRKSYNITGVHDTCESNFHDYLSHIKRDVNFMVQQFEMRKSADDYARTAVHKTGELNVDALYNYKLTDDIFLRQNVTPDGKNHGMVMLLDWSGSMCNIAISTVKQIIVLAQFCRKVQLPFTVYAFTSGGLDKDVKDLSLDNTICQDGFTLVQVLSSSAKKRDMDKDLYHLWCEAHYSERSSYGYPHSYFMDMGGTPLNNVLTMMPAIVNQFKADNKVQKVSLVCLTDGESSPLFYYGLRKSRDGDYLRPTYSWYERVMLRDGAHVYPVGDASESTGNIAKWLSTKVEGMSVMNIFVGHFNACRRYVSHFSSEFMSQSAFKKENAFSVKTDTWPLIVCMSPKAFGEAQSEINVEAGESKQKIRTALKRMLKSKSSSKVILSRMVETFA